MITPDENTDREFLFYIKVVIHEVWALDNTVIHEVLALDNTVIPKVSNGFNCIEKSSGIKGGKWDII